MLGLSGVDVCCCSLSRLSRLSHPLTPWSSWTRTDSARPSRPSPPLAVDRWRRRIWHEDKVLKSKLKHEQDEWERQQAQHALLLLGAKQEDPAQRYKRPLHEQHDDNVSDLLPSYVPASCDADGV